MQYPLAIDKDDDSDFSVIVPDLPGCFSAGKTLEDAIEVAKEAIEGHLECLAEDGLTPAKPQGIDQHFKNPALKGLIWAYADVDTSAFMGKTEKATVTLPTLVIKKIDDLVADGKAKSRSAFLAESASMRL